MFKSLKTEILTVIKLLLYIEGKNVYVFNKSLRLLSIILTTGIENWYLKFLLRKLVWKILNWFMC